MLIECPSGGSSDLKRRKKAEKVEEEDQEGDGGSSDLKRGKYAEKVEEEDQEGDDLKASKIVVDPEAALHKVDAGLTESLAKGNSGSNQMKMGKNFRTNSKFNDEIQSMEQVQTDFELTEDLTEGNVQVRRKEGKKMTENKEKYKDDVQTRSKEDTVSNPRSPNERIKRNSYFSLTENECSAEESKTTIRKKSLYCHIDNKMHSPLASSAVQGNGPLPTQMKLDENMFPCESRHRPTPKEMVVENEKFNVVLTDGNNHTRVCFTPRSRRKLLVLDLNGLLAYIVMPAPKDRTSDTNILGRAIFKRPSCDDFLMFCFQNFDVGIWSSRSKKLVDRIVDYLLGDLKDRLLFCWDISHSTQTEYRTLENIHKPLVFKMLRNVWEGDNPNFAWKKGDYDESNTLLLDDSPYKGLLNPLHTAIFPFSYHYQDKDDKSLGPGGDLRVYLEGLLRSENVQDYVQHNPFGQCAINEMNANWEFYSRVIQATLEHKNLHASIPTLT